MVDVSIIINNPHTLPEEERHYLIIVGAIISNFEMITSIVNNCIVRLFDVEPRVGEAIHNAYNIRSFVGKIEDLKWLFHSKLSELKILEEFIKLGGGANQVRIRAAHSYSIIYLDKGGQTLYRQVSGNWKIDNKMKIYSLNELKDGLTLVDKAHDSAIILYD